MSEAQDPQTPEQWQEAVDHAEALLLIHSARAYGFIKGGPEIDVDRCDAILTRGAALGVQPDQAAVERIGLAWAGVE